MTAISVPRLSSCGTPGDGGGQCAPDDLVCLGGGTGGDSVLRAGRHRSAQVEEDSVLQTTLYA